MFCDTVVQPGVRFDVGKLVGRIWHMQGKPHHHMFRARASYRFEGFDYKCLPKMDAWLQRKSASHALILSGDGCWGKIRMAEALLLPLCPAGFWVFDDPDDSREVEGLIRTELGIPTDEISFQSFDPNQVPRHARRLHFSCYPLAVCAVFRGGASRLHLTVSMTFHFHHTKEAQV